MHAAESVRVDGETYRASCTCGWTSNLTYRNARVAVGVAEGHVLESTDIWVDSEGREWLEVGEDQLILLSDATTLPRWRFDTTGLTRKTLTR
jgi:hypothetical protein